MTWSGSEDLLERLDRYLTPSKAYENVSTGGDIDLLGPEPRKPLRDAGVMIGIVDRGCDDLNVVLTTRPKTMAQHAGQVAFPGGKVDPQDEGPIAAAFREAHEEVGMVPELVSLKGVGDYYITGTGFRILPVVGLLPPDFTAKPDPYEVEDVFETPLSFLMNPANHQRQSAQWGGKQRSYLAMPHNGKYIWGVTAGVIRALYERLYPDGDQA